MDEFKKKGHITLVMHVGEKLPAEGDVYRIKLTPIKLGSNHSPYGKILRRRWVNCYQQMAEMTIELVNSN